MSAPASKLETALGYAARGWPVFPCRPGDKKPLTDHGFKDASTDPEQINAWWRENPRANIGIDCDAAGLVAVDVDVKNGAPGLESWQALVRELGPEICDTAVARTPSGGRHYVYHANGHGLRTSAGKLAAGLDVRAQGGYVIAPGSETPEGIYEWLTDCEPAELPAALAERLAENDRSPAEPLTDASIPVGQRNATLTSLAGTMRRRGMSEQAITAALREENKRCQVPLSEREVDAIAASVAAYEPGVAAPAEDDDLCIRFSDIEAEPVKWVWPRWIPAAMPSILFGPTGLGKSHIYVDIVARISRGAEWPDGGQAPLGTCVILSAEDAAKSVLKPRLVYAGADCSRVLYFPSVSERFDKKGKRVFSLLEDLTMLKTNIVRHGATLAVLDPITAYLSGVDSHIVTEVRAALALVAEVAQSTSVAFLCVMHPNKNVSGDLKAIQRLSGSGAFGDAPRCVMLVAENPDRKAEKRNLLLPAKMNLGLWPEGIGYTITADGPLTCNSRATWDTDPVVVSADDVLKTKRAESPDAQTAGDFLRIALADGEWHRAHDVIDEAELRGIKSWTLDRVRKTMKVQVRKSGFQGPNEWSLPVAEEEAF